MGSWGTGLYSSDFALDLKAVIGAVARLPLEPDELLGLLAAHSHGAAEDIADSDYSAFWLTVADQFASRGIDCPAARERALAIIDGGADLAILERLGMPPKDLAKRRAVLAGLREKIAAAPAAKRPPVLKAPQPFTMETGDMLAYPVAGGRGINPYLASKEKMRPAWVPDGWGAFIVAECGLAFGYLAWYRPLVIGYTLREMPAAGDLASAGVWYLKRAGTCSPSHFKKMELAPFGRLPIDPAKIAERFADRPSAIGDTVADISISNRLMGLRAGPEVPRPKPHPRVPELDDLASILA